MPTEDLAPIQLGNQASGSHLIEVSTRLNIPITIEPKPAYISLNLPLDAFKKEFGGGNNFEAKLCDAIIYFKDPAKHAIVLCRGSEGIEFDLDTGELKAPQHTDSFFLGKLPEILKDGITAAVWGRPKFPDLVYLFRDTQMARWNAGNQTIDSGLQPIANWAAANGTWLGDGGFVAFHAVETRFAGMFHAFKGSEYMRVDLTDAQADARPMPISQQFDLPEPFSQGIDAAFYGFGMDSQKIHFVKGNQFVVYDTVTQRVTGSPRNLFDRWPQLASIFPRPQIFLVEEYELTSLREGLVRGGIKADGTKLEPHGETEYSVIVTRSNSLTLADTTTVLDSSAEVLVNNLNMSTRKASEESTDFENYNYELDASFSGEAEWVGLGADWEKEFNLNGSTNDVRVRFGKSAGEAVDHQVDHTTQVKRESIRVAEGRVETHEETQTSFIKKVKNPTDRAINFAIFEVKELVLMLTTLKNVQVAFANGRELKHFPLAKLDDLLEEFLDRRETDKVIRDGIVNELQRVVNVHGTEVNILRDPQAARLQFNSDLKTEIQLSTGQTITVDGIVTFRQKFAPLTDATMLVELA